MSKFYGEIGYAETVETTPGVYKEKWTRRNYRGDVTKNYRRLEKGESINDNVNVSNVVSIVADPYALNHFHSMRYIRWMGAKWKINNVEVQRPRLNLTIGGVYNE